MNNQFHHYEYNQTSASTSNYHSYNQPPSGPSLEVIRSTDDSDYTTQWIEYFRSIGDYSKALELEQQLMAKQGPSKITIKQGNTYMVFLDLDNKYCKI